jgi:hypothetical protein
MRIFRELQWTEHRHDGIRGDIRDREIIAPLAGSGAG